LNANTNGGAANEFYPEAYGAYRDGTHDDTAAIQAAINAAAANGGGTIVLGNGVYLTSSALVISSSNVNMRGTDAYWQPVSTSTNNGGSTILSNSYTADVLQLTGTSVNSLASCHLQDFNVSRNVRAVGTAAGIRYSYCVVCSALRIRASNHIQGFSTNNTVGVLRFDYCDVYQYLGTPNSSSGFFGSFSNSCYINNCTVGLCTYGYNLNGGNADTSVYGLNTAGCSYGVYITGTCEDVQFINCIHDSTSVSAYYISGSTGSIQIIGGYSNCGGISLDIENSSGVSCTGFQFGASGIAGTQVEINGTVSQGNIITDNNFLMASPGTAILLNNCSNNSVIGNSIRSPKYGIVCTSASNNVIVGNSIYGASGAVVTTGISFDSSSNNNSEVNSVNPAYVTTPISNSGSGNGISGATGATGPTGATGTNGTNGATGATGTGSGGVAINGPTGSSYTAVLTDANQIVSMGYTGATASFLIPLNSSVAFPVGTTLSVTQTGPTGPAGVGITGATGGVTIETPASQTTRVQYSTIAALQVAANTWLLMGDLT
jgi:parallel beta-helix repeat protein